MVEFAIVATVLVPLMMYSMYFVDLAKARLKTAEIARYAVWEMTSFPHSDYNDKNHNRLFEYASGEVAADVEKRYSDDLLADTEDHEKTEYSTAHWRLAQIVLTNQEANFIPNNTPFQQNGGQGISEILGAISGTINKILAFWGFNTKGQAKVDVSLEVENTFIPKQYAQEFYEADLFPETIKTLTFRESYVMVVDSWTLLDGEDVQVPGGYTKGTRETPYYKQVNRLVWLGANNIPILGDILNFMSRMQDWPVLNSIIDPAPLGTRMVSIASRGDDLNKANDVEVNVDVGQKFFHTTPIRDKDLSPMSSEYGKTYNKRGDWYMGCKQSQQLKCSW